MLATSRLNRLPASEHGITIGDFLVPVLIGEHIGARVRNGSLVILGAILIALTAAFSIRLPDNPVPITGQTLGVLLVGGALGLRRGSLATLLYLAVGVIGFPAFAEHKSGLAVIASIQEGRIVLGTNGGYLIGFVLASAAVGRLAELGWDRRIGGALGAMFIGNVIVYVVGLPWLMAATGFSAQRTIDLGLAPFLVGDALKLALAAGLFPIAWWVVGRRSDDR